MISLLKKHKTILFSGGAWDKELAPAYKLQHPPFSWHRKSKAWESAQGQIGSRNQQGSPIQAQNCPVCKQAAGPVKAPDGSSGMVPAHKIRAMRADGQKEINSAIPDLIFMKEWKSTLHKGGRAERGFKDLHLIEPRPSCHRQCLLDRVSSC